jgi:hypothetical protein
VVDLGPDSVLCLYGGQVLLRNHHPYEEGHRYLWNTGATTPQLNVTQAGTYTLTVANAQGCATTASICINKDCYIDIPDAFTPNGDGVNNYSYPGSG